MLTFDVYCPTCRETGLDTGMLLNEYDLFECAYCGLQVMLVVPGVQAVVLSEIGNGKLSDGKHNQHFGKVLYKQDLNYPPFSKLSKPIEDIGELMAWLG